MAGLPEAVHNVDFSLTFYRLRSLTRKEGKLPKFALCEAWLYLPLSGAVEGVYCAANSLMPSVQSACIFYASLLRSPIQGCRSLPVEVSGWIRNVLHRRVFCHRFGLSVLRRIQHCPGSRLLYGQWNPKLKQVDEISQLLRNSHLLNDTGGSS